MFHQIIAVITLGAGGLNAPEVARGYDTHDQVVYARFGVEFRQPDWRDYVFGSPQEMDEFIADKQRNGWELQLFPGELRVRYRLTQWGGSRIFDNPPEAQAWAAYLQRQLGSEPG